MNHKSTAIVIVAAVISTIGCGPGTESSGSENTNTLTTDSGDSFEIIIDENNSMTIIDQDDTELDLSAVDDLELNIDAVDNGDLKVVAISSGATATLTDPALNGPVEFDIAFDFDAGSSPAGALPEDECTEIRNDLLFTCGVMDQIDDPNLLWDFLTTELSSEQQEELGLSEQLFKESLYPKYIGTWEPFCDETIKRATIEASAFCVWITG